MVQTTTETTGQFPKTGNFSILVCGENICFGTGKHCSNGTHDDIFMRLGNFIPITFINWGIQFEQASITIKSIELFDECCSFHINPFFSLL